MNDERRPYGLWLSPISPDALSEALRLLEAEWRRDGRELVWLEERSGQGVLRASALDGQASRQISSGHSVRARVGYGGGCLAVGSTALVYVAEDGRLYRQALASGAARPITPPGVMCASPVLSPDERWVVYVYEVEGGSGLAVVPADGAQWPQRVAWGHDFCMQPVWRPDGHALAWVAWDHPNMPWDAGALYLQELAPTPAGWAPETPRQVAGGPGESVLQPQFAPDSARLAYLSDREGWWRLYVCDPAAPQAAHRCLTPAEAEHGGPAWQQGMRWYGWLPDGRALAVLCNREAATALQVVNADGGGAAPFPGAGEPYSDMVRPAVNPVDGRVAVFASGEGVPARLVVLPAPAGAPGGGDSPAAPRVVRRSAAEQTEPEMLAAMRAITWRSPDGETVHGLFAAPTHARYRGEGLPPLVVTVHGGPTGQALRRWRPDVQFFTSRGYAFLDVNHRGSSGYGRAYRERLREQWGLLDVADAVAGARHVAAQGWADPERCAIRGSSAGGYTVLRALTTEPDLFRAGICLYGIADLMALARETHRFEAHYLDTLIGPLPRFAERYRERSPLHAAERISAPLLILQGQDDQVVPPAQAEAIVGSLRARGVPHVYRLFEGEGHGFRRRETLRAVWETIERFLETHLVYG